MTENRLFCGCLIRHGFLRLVTLVFLVGGQAFLPTRANASIIFTQLDPTCVVQANGNNPLFLSYDIDINSDGKRDVWVGFNGKAGNISSYGDVGFLGYLPNLSLQNDSTVYRLEPVPLSVQIYQMKSPISLSHVAIMSILWEIRWEISM